MKSNGSFTSAIASSLLLNVRAVPPVLLLASMKLKLRPARFVLAGAAVTVNDGPVAVWAKTETVIGPVVAPNGTTAVIAFTLALIIFAVVPLNATPIFCVRGSKWSPSITTWVDGGPSRGETRLIVGGCEE